MELLIFKGDGKLLAALAEKMLRLKGGGGLSPPINPHSLPIYGGVVRSPHNEELWFLRCKLGYMTSKIVRSTVAFPILVFNRIHRPAKSIRDVLPLLAYFIHVFIHHLFDLFSYAFRTFANHRFFSASTY